MKRLIAFVLVILLALSAAALTACGSSGSLKELNFTTVGELKDSGTEYDFITFNSSLEDDLVVCEIKKDASGDIVIPAEYEKQTVIAVISEDPSNEQVTSITVENGVQFIENCFNKKSALEKLELPAGFKEIYHSFNHSDALTEVSIPSTTLYVVDSFCDCAKLAKAETAGYLYGITDAFLNDAALTDLAVGGAVQNIDNSFNGCGITGVEFAENIHDITGSFNDCPALKSAVTKQIAGDFSRSFCNCAALTDVKYEQGVGSIFKCFNDCAVLENVDFGAGAGNISESFENCPKYTLPEPAEEG